MTFLPHSILLFINTSDVDIYFVLPFAGITFYSENFGLEATVALRQ